MNVLHIAARELRATYTTTVGWLVLCGWLLVTGLFWTASVQAYALQSQELILDPYTAAQLNLSDWLLTPYFVNCAVLLMMVLPAVSMRLFAEEIKQRTLELLMTSPVSTLEIVLGKYLGALAVLAVMLAGTLPGPLLLYVWGSPDPGVIASGYAGLFLLGSGLLSVGLLASASTSNQLVAFGVTIAVAFTLLVANWMSREPGDLMWQISMLGHLNGLFEGAAKLSDLVYLAGFSFVFVFATHQRMESFRWQ